MSQRSLASLRLLSSYTCRHHFSKRWSSFSWPRHDTNPKRYPRFQMIPNVHGQWTTVQDLIRFDQHLKHGEKSNELITLTGRIVSKRESSNKLIFYDVVQNGETIQIVSSQGRFQGDPVAFAESNQAVSRGDIVAFTGVPGKTNRGQLSVFVTKDIRLLSPCLRDIPRAGLKDQEKRFRLRHVDMLVNPEVTHIFRTRTKIIRHIRQFFDNRGFLEVETPILASKAGGAAARPFLTHAHALGMDLHLRIAPELYLKQLVIGGLDRVYEIGKQFRNEGIDADHNPEFTTCEFYQAYGNLDSLIDDTEALVTELVQLTQQSSALTFANDTVITFDRPFRRIHVTNALESRLGSLAWLDEDSPQTVERLHSLCIQHGLSISGPITIPRLLDRCISQWIESECTQPTFLTHHPIALSPLSKDCHDASGCRTAARFELFVAGKEIVNAYEELNDPDEQRRRFAQQQQDRQHGDLEAPIPDTEFCDALEYALPPTAGWGMGVDRVVQLLTGAKHIREVLAFPLMRPLTDDKESVPV